MNTLKGFILSDATVVIHITLLREEIGQMKTNEFLFQVVCKMHATLMEDVKDCTIEQLVWQPQGKESTIGINLWHYIVEEDILISTLQGTEPIWNSENFAKRCNIPTICQWFGSYTPEQVTRFVIAKKDCFMLYVHRVMENTEKFISTFLDNVDPSLAWTIINLINAHGFNRLGEIRYIKEMGLPVPKYERTLRKRP
ncbi:MAG: hypothetical protein SVW57_12650 [Thermodesulfobacteriota bacterium]|nr:hypothetical protein [Thermodesulfobacteriota bacterium]